MKKIKVGYLPLYIKLYDDSNPHYRDPMVDYMHMLIKMLESQGLEVVLADEVFTPDSSRFWDAADYEVGVSPKSFDKQFARDWLIENKLDGVTPPPELPAEIVEKTRDKYMECMKRIVG